jgi:hypothetical protein
MLMWKKPRKWTNLWWDLPQTNFVSIPSVLLNAEFSHMGSLTSFICLKFKNWKVIASVPYISPHTHKVHRQLKISNWCNNEVNGVVFFFCFSLNWWVAGRERNGVTSKGGSFLALGCTLFYMWLVHVCEGPQNTLHKVLITFKFFFFKKISSNTCCFLL